MWEVVVSESVRLAQLMPHYTTPSPHSTMRKIFFETFVNIVRSCIYFYILCLDLQYTTMMIEPWLVVVGESRILITGHCKLSELVKASCTE